jgi:LysR family glycine cleavage system transcriptional activator
MSKALTLIRMATRLPPMQALRAFEAAARERSLTKAAQLLHLTHGAISHQIKALEADLGVRLV